MVNDFQQVGDHVFLREGRRGLGPFPDASNGDIRQQVMDICEGVVIAPLMEGELERGLLLQGKRRCDPLFEMARSRR